MKNKFIPLISAAFLLINSNVFADKLTQSKIHFNSIASGDINKLMGQYNQNARLDWIGGPLDGSYSGNDELRTVWKKFTKALGPMKTSVSNIKENSNPKGSTVTADVLFKGKKTIPVRYTLLYRDNEIVNEIWQISPAIAKQY
ncbi:MAG: nuclear transport factor 2 family protein [Gammaproteobacteria bacterium]|nr:nuclear transport factor 2 family protein [Gammaproteobacteria bacterium]